MYVCMYVLYSVYRVDYRGAAAAPKNKTDEEGEYFVLNFLRACK